MPSSARFGAILRAVARASHRRSKSLLQVTGNNMFYAGVTLLFLLDPVAMQFFFVLIALVLFLPSSSDPMTVAPRERLHLWPLKAWERYGLRLMSPLLNPLTWLVLAGMAWKRVTWGLWSFVAGFFFTGFVAASVPTMNLWVPRIPLGRFTEMVRKDLRQFLTALDVYCALLLAGPALYLRIVGTLPADAYAPLTGLVVIMLSTLALTLFGLDGVGGMQRYRLLPVRGWRILAAKGIAYLLLTLFLTAPLSPGGGLAGSLIALAVGQFHSVRQVAPQAKWHFRSSSPFGYSLAQMIAAILGFAAVTQFGVVWLAACTAVYGCSLWICGQRLDAAIDQPE